MTDDSARARINRYTSTPASDAGEASAMSEDYPSYGILRGASAYALMLDLRLRTGDHTALPYAYLDAINFDASGTLNLSFGARTVTVEGRNLRPIFEQLLTHSIRFLQEQRGAADDGAADCFIASITITQPEAG